MPPTPDQLTPADWAVLSLVSEGPTHGFAIARLLEPGGEVGRVWAVRRPLVYRSMEVLEAAGLIKEEGTEPSTAGPPRRLMTCAAEGTLAIEEWRRAPVSRVRDARSQLLLKLLFDNRADRSSDQLLLDQRDLFTDRCNDLRRLVEEAQGFQRTLALWRLETTEAALRFTNAVLDPD